MANMPVYLADFSCFNAPDELKVDFRESQEAAWRWKVRTIQFGLMHCLIQQQLKGSITHWLSGTIQPTVVINAIFYVQKTPDRPHLLHNSAHWIFSWLFRHKFGQLVSSRCLPLSIKVILL